MVLSYFEGYSGVAFTNEECVARAKTVECYIIFVQYGISMYRLKTLISFYRLFIFKLFLTKEMQFRRKEAPTTPNSCQNILQSQSHNIYFAIDKIH